MRNASKTVVLIATVGTLIVSSTLLGCGLWRGDPPSMIGLAGAAESPEPVELRIHEVPAEVRDDLRSMLRSVLGSGETGLGRVTDGPGATLIVVAPPRIQAGVQQLLEADFEAPRTPSPIKLTYWLLVGRPLAASEAAEPFSVVAGRSLPQLEPVLSQIAGAQGPTEFSLLEEIQLTSMSQARGEAAGKFARVSQTATRTAEQVVSFVEIHLQGRMGPSNSFQSRVVLDVGQFLVVGQAGFGGSPIRAFQDATLEDKLTLYYVMVADLEP